MKKLYFWILRRIVKKLIKQSCGYEYDIEQYYKIMSEEAYKRFNEENKMSLYNYLSERHKKAHFDII